MKAVVQRVSRASVKVENRIVGEIENGFLVLLGVVEGDSEAEMKTLAKKIYEMRIFKDENDKMNLSLENVGGSVLVVSQFTLCADLSHGRRPSYFASAKPDVANVIYERFCEELKYLGVKNVQKGIFGARMEVELVNDGPVTIIVDTDALK